MNSGRFDVISWCRLNKFRFSNLHSRPLSSPHEQKRSFCPAFLSTSTELQFLIIFTSLKIDLHFHIVPHSALGTSISIFHACTRQINSIPCRDHRGERRQATAKNCASCASQGRRNSQLGCINHMNLYIYNFSLAITFALSPSPQPNYLAPTLLPTVQLSHTLSRVYFPVHS